MGIGGGVFVVAAGLAVLALAAFAAYSRRRRQRRREVGRWVRGFLAARYGAVPAGLHVDCSDDALWPVLVSFTSPRTGARHDMRFSCGGPASTFSLLAGGEEKAADGPAAS
jgi:hypothetical protein